MRLNQIPIAIAALGAVALLSCRDASRGTATEDGGVTQTVPYDETAALDEETDSPSVIPTPPADMENEGDDMTTSTGAGSGRGVMEDETTTTSQDEGIDTTGDRDVDGNLVPLEDRAGDLDTQDPATEEGAAEDTPGDETIEDPDTENEMLDDVPDNTPDTRGSRPGRT